MVATAPDVPGVPEMPGVVVVGASLGGLDALRGLLAGLRAPLVPMLIVQHRGPEGDATLARLLAEASGLRVTEAEDKEALEPGHVYVAPPGYHLLVEPGSLALSTDAPVNWARPSVDVLFESAAVAYGPGCIGVILTGANQDGARGCAEIKKRGGTVLVQDPATAAASAMPAAAIAASAVDQVLPLGEVAAVLAVLCGGEASTAGEGLRG